MSDKTERARLKENAAETALSRMLREGEDTLRRNQDYEPSRETDEYILDRFSENLPFQRPETDPGSIKPPNQGYGSPTATPGWRYAKRFPEAAESESPYYHDKNRREILAGWKQFEEDLDTLSRPRGRVSGRQQAKIRAEGSYPGIQGFSRSLDASMLNKKDLTPQERQQLEDLQNALAEDMTAPGAQEDRPGRLQEIIEALDLTNPESVSRAGLRKLKRTMIDDRVPRIHAGWKTKTGEEVLKDKLIEMGLYDIPRNRHAAMQALGWLGIPKTVKLKDDSGNPVPLYVDEMKADREAAAEKAYRQRGRDPIKDTPERD